MTLEKCLRADVREVHSLISKHYNSNNPLTSLPFLEEYYFSEKNQFLFCWRNEGTISSILGLKALHTVHSSDKAIVLMDWLSNVETPINTGFTLFRQTHNLYKDDYCIICVLPSTINKAITSKMGYKYFVYDRYLYYNTDKPTAIFINAGNHTIESANRTKRLSITYSLFKRQFVLIVSRKHSGSNRIDIVSQEDNRKICSIDEVFLNKLESQLRLVSIESQINRLGQQQFKLIIELLIFLTHERQAATADFYLLFSHTHLIQILKDYGFNNITTETSYPSRYKPIEEPQKLMDAQIFNAGIYNEPLVIGDTDAALNW